MTLLHRRQANVGYVQSHAVRSFQYEQLYMASPLFKCTHTGELKQSYPNFQIPPVSGLPDPMKAFFRLAQL